MIVICVCPLRMKCLLRLVGKSIKVVLRTLSSKSSIVSVVDGDKNLVQYSIRRRRIIYGQYNNNSSDKQLSPL